MDPGKTGGYILEWDFRKGADYNVNLGSDSGYVGVKEPENDSTASRQPDTGEGISSAAEDVHQQLPQRADSALRAAAASDAPAGRTTSTDASAVDYYIAMEFMKPVDGNMWASVYMYKPRSGKLNFGPMWDFDLAAGSANRAGNVVSSSSFYLRNNLGVSAQQSSNTWFNCLNKRLELPGRRQGALERVKNDLDTNSLHRQPVGHHRALGERSRTRVARWREPQLPHQPVPGHQEQLER